MLDRIAKLLLIVFVVPFWAQASEVSLEWKNPQELVDSAELRSMYIHAFLAAYRISSIPTDETAFLENYFDSCVKPQMQKAELALFAKIEHRIVGMLLFEQTGSSVYIAELAIDPEFQRKGIGKQMMSMFSDAQKIWLITESRNIAAKEFYLHLGFIPASVMHAGYDPSLYCGFEKSLSH